MKMRADRDTGSNIKSVLSATAVALATTAAASAYVENADAYSTVAFVEGPSSGNLTDSQFVLAPVASERSFVSDSLLWSTWNSVKQSLFIDAAPSYFQLLQKTSKNAPTVTVRSPVSTIVDVRLDSARLFYLALPDEVKSDLVEELVSVCFLSGGHTPTIEKIDDMITLDVSVPGRSLGVLLESDFCAVSSFSHFKEIKATYDVRDLGAREELKDFIQNELFAFNKV